MTLGERIEMLMSQQGISQAELARRVGVKQPSIYALLRKNKTGSRNLHQIARALGTTPEFLSGEIDDPSAGAPPPPPAPAFQHITMQVALPPEGALERGFLGLLAASRHMDEAALAHELAAQLPTMLSVLSGPIRMERAPSALAEAAPTGDPVRRRA